MSTIKLYDDQPYGKEFQAEVLSCDPVKKDGRDAFAVVLDQTLFFPEEGGQSPDTGKLGAAELPDTSSGGGGVTVTHGSAVAEATAALVSLGYSQTEIGAALKTVEGAETLTAEQLVRQALRAMVTK